MTAEQLLDEMRPEVERILQQCDAEFNGAIGGAPSQSLRAHNSIRKITEVSDDRSTAVQRRFALNKLKWRLEKFLAVWETVRIIERRGRDAKLDIFGIDSL